MTVKTGPAKTGPAGLFATAMRTAAATRVSCNNVHSLFHSTFHSSNYIHHYDDDDDENDDDYTTHQYIASVGEKMTSQLKGMNV